MKEGRQDVDPGRYSQMNGRKKKKGGQCVKRNDTESSSVILVVAAEVTTALGFAGNGRETDSTHNVPIFFKKKKRTMFHRSIAVW